MPDQSEDFAGLLCSRLCHDLMSPIGALGNGLELLAEETDAAMRARCMELIQDSARAAADKLKFFRIAFGATGAAGDTVSSADVRAALDGLVSGNKRVEMGWLVDQPSLPRAIAKILLNLALIGLDALVRGGRLDVGAEGGEVVVRAEGPRLVLDAEIRTVLDGTAEPDGISARTAAAWLVRRLAETNGGQVTLADDEAGVLLLAVSLPG